jgi:hypothetical protein
MDWQVFVARLTAGEWKSIDFGIKYTKLLFGTAPVTP